MLKDKKKIDIKEKENKKDRCWFGLTPHNCDLDHKIRILASEKIMIYTQN
jgi:hypothetical protein